LAQVTQKSLERYDRARGKLWRPVFARPPALVVWGRLRPAAAGSSRSAARSRDRCAVCARRQAPLRLLGPSLIAVTGRERLISAVTAVTRRQRRDRAGTAVIAVSAVIAGFVLLGPSGPLRTVAKGAVPPMTSVLAVTAVTLPIVTPQGGHRPTTAAVIALGPCLP
jgi:hypothetical protein